MIPPGVDVSELEPPRPRVTPTTRPFWDALRAHRLEIQRCEACGTWVHYPRVRCTACGSDRLRFEEVDPRATIHTVTVARQPTAPHFHAHVPQVIAIVELANGVRLTTTVLADDPAALACGDALEPVFDDGPDGITLLRYRPAGGAAG